MSYSFRLFIVSIAALGAASVACAAGPAPGEYEALHELGTLSIRSEESGATSFRIFTVGANAHMCELSGQVKGDKGYTDVEEGSQEPQCVISFKTAPNGYSVSTQTEDACRDFCGARAGFEGDYLLPPAGCKLAERAQRRANFQSQYDAKDYRRAYETLDAFYKQCGNFLHWMTLDDVRNDLAVTLHHLGRDDACLATLKENTVGTESGEVLSLPPADQEAFQPIAKATWYNLKLCGKGAAKARTR